MKENIVYLIGFVGYNKFYIGSSCRGLYRKREHFYTLNKNKHSNHYLQRVFNQYGEQKLFFHIIERVENLENLRLREQFWVDIFNTTNKDYGMNLVKDVTKIGTIGYKHSEEQKRNLSRIVKGRKANGKIAEGIGNCHAKNYTIYSPEGEKIEITNLKYFCKQNNLKYNRMLKVVKGQLIEEKGFKLSLDRQNLTIKNFTFINPDGNIINITNLKKFCKENNLSERAMYAAHEKKQYYKGWAGFPPREKIKRIITKTFVSPSGEIIITDDRIQDFCKKNKINFDAINSNKEWNGWKLISKEFKKSSFIKKSKQKKGKKLYIFKNIETKEIVESKCINTFASQIKTSRYKVKDLMKGVIDILKKYIFIECKIYY